MKATFTNIVVTTILISIIISCVITHNSFYIFSLNENQLLYLFSMKGQIIGGIFALTLTAYTFYGDKLRDIGMKDEDYYEATLELRRKSFIDLIIIAIIVVISILFCLIGIVMIDTKYTIYPFIINQSSILFCITLVSILRFGVTLLNPHKIDNEIRALGKKVEEKYPINNNDIATMGEFVTAYNILEKSIITASEILYGIHFNKEKRYGQFKPQIIQALKLLLRYKTIDEKQHDELHEIRMYRNSIVHSIDNFDISKSVCNRMSELNQLINQNVSQEKETVTKDVNN